MRKKHNSKRNWSRRNFLQTVGAGVPTLSLVMHGTNAATNGGAGKEPSVASEKFTPVELGPHYSASPTEFGPREQARGLSGDPNRDGLLRTAVGEQSCRGIPFGLGPEGLSTKRWLALSKREVAWTKREVEIPVGQRAGFVCLAAFCDWDKNEAPPPGEDAAENVGQRLGEVVLVYEEGGEATLPIRRRFEVGAPTIPWGHLCFAALSQQADTPHPLSNPLTNGLDWGNQQTAVFDRSYPDGPDGRARAIVWISALANPAPEKTIKSLRLRAVADEPLVVCGLTLFRGRENPLRLERLALYRFTLPEATAGEGSRWQVSVDLGTVARTYALGEFNPAAWLDAPDAGLGERKQAARGAPYLYAEVTASREATLLLSDTKSGKNYEFALSKVEPGKELEAQAGGARVEILEPHKVWLHGKVVDKATGRPTPVRLAFRSKQGRYIPPYGHRAEINDAWFQDYGADVKVMDTPFAYVDGTFQVELPVGEVYVEMTKGFEYAPVRKKLVIESGQRELQLEISRHANLRAQGWVTADTHVHFLSPSTALLEAQAEGLNFISLLAAQWGDLFTNVGDLAHGPLTSPDGDTLVQVNTENRQHLLGHLALHGVQGAPAFPMSASGPGESYLGDPVWTTMSGWADTAHERKGLVVAVHFPYPTAEIAAEIILGKIDAVELFPYTQHFNALQFLDWYRYLNCGYRVPAVGGTDKMGAYMPAGTNRTYAYLGREEFNFANWAKAIRSGNTFSTTGPMLLFHADGHVPGEEIALGAGGGTVEVRVEAKSFVPFHRLEVVLNGKAVVVREEREGTRDLTLHENVKVPGAGWLAARCASRLGATTAWNLAIAAHTSPVYVRVPGEELFSPQGAAYMLTLIEGAQTWVENLATRPDPDRFERVRKTLGEAREQLHRRLHQHGIAH
ncbi:MAG: CehA/McbA family metallohydrolase [Acidobacteriia bacterium]|nr:CehA/McbA family metallohydrolase [Terriglobia bacterium]